MNKKRLKFEAIEVYGLVMAHLIILPYFIVKKRGIAREKTAFILLGAQFCARVLRWTLGFLVSLGGLHCSTAYYHAPLALGLRNLVDISYMPW